MIEELENLYVMNRIGRSGVKKDPMTILEQITDFNVQDGDGRNLLQIAVSNVDLKAVSYLLDKGTEVEVDNLNNSLLHALVKSPYLVKKADIIANEEVLFELTKLLLELKIKPKRKNDYDEVAYVLAAQKLAYPILRAIAQAQVKMDAPMENGMNLMHYILEMSSYNAVSDEDQQCIKFTIKALIDSGLDPEDKDAFGNIPEYYAKKADLRDVVAVLQGNETGVAEDTMSLREALSKKEYEAVYKILASGADINEVDPTDQMTPLMWFCFVADKDAVQYLVNKRVDTNFIEGATGNSALSLLIERGYYNLAGKPLNTLTDILKVISKGEVNLDAIIDAQGNTALNLVCKQEDMEGVTAKMVDILVDQEVDVNLPDLEGLTPIMSFAKYNGQELKLNIIESLLDEDADVSGIDKFGNTVLSYAAMNSRENDAKKIAELVLQVDASLVNTVNNQGKTALDIAIESGNEACAKVILMNM